MISAQAEVHPPPTFHSEANCLCCRIPTKGLTDDGSGLTGSVRFPPLNVAVRPSLVGESAAAGTNRTADQRAFAASQNAADHRSPNCRPADNLRARVMPVIAGSLRRDRPVVTPLCSRFLSTREERKNKH
jgi:hypothetical protein